MKTPLLRTAFLFLIFHFSFLIGKAQGFAVPDTAFRNWLMTNGYANCVFNNQLWSNCTEVRNTWQLSIGGSNIRDLTGIEAFYRLTDLQVEGTQITTLPTLPDSVIMLFCRNNQITNISTLPPMIDYFDCTGNQLTSLPSLQGTRFLTCDNNQLTSLPPLPINFRDLNCSNNLLTSLPALPSTTRMLICRDNLLTSLPTLPAGFWFRLDCSNNPLTSLPALPSVLRTLQCRNTQLTALPPLPSSLRWLDCGNNLLTNISSLPTVVNSLWCDSNQLTSLPVLPDSLTNCFLGSNPIACLPFLKRIVNLDFMNTNVSCMPNYGSNITNSNPAFNLYPTCDIFNSNSCDFYLNINGKTHYDENSNCIDDGSDVGQRNVKVKLWSSGTLLQQTLTYGEGAYIFGIGSFGNYELSIDTSNIPLYVSCPANSMLYDTIGAVDSLHYNRNFSLECKPGFDLAAWSIAGRFRPANVRKVDIHVGGSSNFYGINCSGGITGNVVIQVTGPATYVAPAVGALTPDNVSGNTLTYNVADFGTVDFNNSFNIMVQTDTTAPLGSQVCFTVTVTPITGDDVQSNNIQTHCFTVVGSYDPNDKQVYPSANIDTAQEWLTYTVRFQNTGTAEAQHIYITDTLDADLDVSSFQLLAYSHQPLVQLKEDAVRFNFPNINLPDSNTNEPLSHGYVQYKIKLKDNLSIGTQINNTAFIYFDFNAPVVTNTTTNTIAVISGLADNRQRTTDIRLFPNPASDAVTISVDETMIGATATITDITGRKMAAVSLTTQYSLLNTRHLPNGLYFITIESGKQKATQKLIITK